MGLELPENLRLFYHGPGQFYELAELALRLAIQLHQCLAALLLWLAPIWRRFSRPLAYCAGLVRQAAEGILFYSSMVLLSGRLLLLRKSLSSKGKQAAQFFTLMFLRPTIALVIKLSKVNYAISRCIRHASHHAEYVLTVLLVLPKSFIQMFQLFVILFEFFRSVFTIFRTVIEVVFSHAIFIFKTYKMVVVCSASILSSVYYTGYYCTLLIASGLNCLNGFTSLLQNVTLRRVLINYKSGDQRQATNRKKK